MASLAGKGFTPPSLNFLSSSRIFSQSCFICWLIWSNISGIFSFNFNDKNNHTVELSIRLYSHALLMPKSVRNSIYFGPVLVWPINLKHLESSTILFKTGHRFVNKRTSQPRSELKYGYREKVNIGAWCQGQNTLGNIAIYVEEFTYNEPARMFLKVIDKFKNFLLPDLRYCHLFLRHFNPPINN